MNIYPAAPVAVGLVAIGLVAIVHFGVLLGGFLGSGRPNIAWTPSTSAAPASWTTTPPPPTIGIAVFLVVAVLAICLGSILGDLYNLVACDDPPAVCRCTAFLAVAVLAACLGSIIGDLFILIDPAFECRRCTTFLAVAVLAACLGSILGDLFNGLLHLRRRRRLIHDQRCQHPRG